MSELLAAHSLSVAYRGRRTDNQVLLDVSLELVAGRVIGLAGESGSGKSTLALSLMGYRPAGQHVISGEVDLDGSSITAASISRLRELWGARLAYLPQDTSTSLNPALSIGRLFIESLRKHERLSRSAARERAMQWLERVAILEPDQALQRYPHQFSGGQQQRIAIALALCLGPAVLILDEPTTGLDVVTQARVNELVTSLARESGVATLYVSHNLAMLATVCDDLAIMYAGQIVESGPVASVYDMPRHPYTTALIRAVPTIDSDEAPRGIPGIPRATVATNECGFLARCPLRAEECRATIPMVDVGERHTARCVRVGASTTATAATTLTTVRPHDQAVSPMLSIDDVTVTFGRRGHAPAFRAVDHVSLDVYAGRTLGIAGESGSGKSTLLRVIAGLLRADSGTLAFRGASLPPLAVRRSVEHRRAIQIVFQNPDSTLNPRHTIRQSLERPLRLFSPGIGRAELTARIAAVTNQVRISPELLDRYPRNLSGGQRQRVAIARALLADPVLLLCDEVTSALDVSVQASIIELLIELRESRGLAIVFVTHDLGVLRSIADEVIVMQNGAIRERGEVTSVLRAPQDTYTQRLIAAIPTPRRDSAQSVPAQPEREPADSRPAQPERDEVIAP
ncbi:MAG TPA: ABC transporter ATP-binding protein [Micromonosporaceae bacterium]